MKVFPEDYEKALELFKLQIKCVVNDDRKTQMGIYAENLHYEFPTANDRPKIIDGRDNFRKVMEPIWERRRNSSIETSLDKYEFHATDEEGLFVGVIVLKAVIDKKEEPVTVTFVQLLRIFDGYIIEVREFF